MEVDEAITGLAEDLFAGKVVQVDTKEGFKLKLHETNPDEPRSPIFLNIRTPNNPKPGPVTPALMEKIGRLLWRYARMTGLQFDGVAGLPNAGTPIAEAFAAAAAADGHKIPLIRLHKTTTRDGRQIDDILDTAGVERGSVVLLIDDLITGGHTKDEGINVLESKGGYLVLDALVVVDRQQGGSEYLGQRGIKLHYLLTLLEIIDLLQEKELISLEDADTILRYLGDTSPGK